MPLVFIQHLKHIGNCCTNATKSSNRQYITIYMFLRTRLCCPLTDTPGNTSYLSAAFLYFVLFLQLVRLCMISFMISVVVVEITLLHILNNTQLARRFSTTHFHHLHMAKTLTYFRNFIQLPGIIRTNSLILTRNPQVVEHHVWFNFSCLLLNSKTATRNVTKTILWGNLSWQLYFNLPCDWKKRIHFFLLLIKVVTHVWGVGWGVWWFDIAIYLAFRYSIIKIKMFNLFKWVNVHSI